LTDVLYHQWGIVYKQDDFDILYHQWGIVYKQDDFIVKTRPFI